MTWLRFGKGERGVNELAAGKGFTFVDNGEATLKGFEKPVRVYEVRWRR